MPQPRAETSKPDSIIHEVPISHDLLQLTQQFVSKRLGDNFLDQLFSV